MKQAMNSNDDNRHFWGTPPQDSPQPPQPPIYQAPQPQPNYLQGCYGICVLIGCALPMILFGLTILWALIASLFSH